MKIKKFTHNNVSADGKIKNGGAVETKDSVRMGRGDGCGLDNCHCSDGYWITIVMPLSDEKIEGIQVKFDSKLEFDKFFEAGELNG